MPGNAVGYVHRILVDPQINVVRRLYVVANETRIAVVLGAGQVGLAVRPGTRRDLRRYGSEGLVLKNCWNLVGILAVDGAEVEVLIAEAQEQFLAADGSSAFTDDRPKTLVGSRHLELGGLIKRKGNSRGGRRYGQLGNLYS